MPAAQLAPLTRIARAARLARCARLARVALPVALVAATAWPRLAPAQGAAPALAPSLTKAVACACFEGSELKIDKSRSVAECDCPYADDVRRDLAAAVATVPKAQRGDRVQIALAVEKHWLTASPEYERMLRYDNERYTWFLQNVRCTCSGCKATVYFSNCQLTCTPAIVYKRRARVWLALGFSTDQLIDYYLAEHNATHAAREQITRAWLLPKRERRRGWLVPALLIGGAIFVLGGLLSRVVRRSRAARGAQTGNGTPAAPGPGGPNPEAPGANPASESASREERNRVLDALDDLERDGGW